MLFRSDRGSSSGHERALVHCTADLGSSAGHERALVHCTADLGSSADASQAGACPLHRRPWQQCRRVTSGRLSIAPPTVAVVQTRHKRALVHCTADRGSSTDASQASTYPLHRRLWQQCRRITTRTWEDTWTRCKRGHLLFLSKTSG